MVDTVDLKKIFKVNNEKPLTTLLWEPDCPLKTALWAVKIYVRNRTHYLKEPINLWDENDPAWRTLRALFDAPHWEKVSNEKKYALAKKLGIYEIIKQANYYHWQAILL